MFDNIGSKIKSQAVGVTVVGIAFSCIFGIVIMLENFAIGLLIAIFGSLASWGSSLTLYVFGHLIEKVDIIANAQEQQHSTPKNDLPEEEIKKEVKPQVRIEADYSCKSLIETGSHTRGMCLICMTTHDNLEYCKIKSKMGTRELYICDYCKEQFKSNIKE